MAVSKADQTAQEDVITMDRRRSDRRENDSEPSQAREIKAPRRKKQRRRHIDPTTCERDYSEQEIEFMRAMDDYKRDSGRMFPTCSEVLEVIRKLGYHQLDQEQIEDLGLFVIEQPEQAEAKQESLEEAEAEA